MKNLIMKNFLAKFCAALLSAVALLVNPLALVHGQTWTSDEKSEAANLSAPALPTLAYGIREPGTLGGNSSFARDINDRGQITGSANTPNGRLHTFLWGNGAVRDLGFPPTGVEFSSWLDTARRHGRRFDMPVKGSREFRLLVRRFSAI